MLRNIFQRPIRDNFVVVDSLFPQKEPFAFRNAEINEYFKRLDGFGSYTMYPMMPDASAWFTHGYGMTAEEFAANKAGYLEHYPENELGVHYLDPGKKYSFNLAYSFFAGETYVLLPFYEKNNTPFVFVLYPGGCFGLDFDGSDKVLQRIFSSKCFRGVIVTQQITRDYLIKKNLCPEDSIGYIYGGFVQFKKQQVLPKRYYKKDKPTFDICFVAAKYTEKGVDKGYDLFIETAKLLAKKAKDIRFHVVGGFDETDIDVRELGSRITFYGYRKPDFLLDFYAGMDIFLAPNRPKMIFEGNFDGFPLGIDAGYCGTALFVADELRMNHHYTKDKIVIVTLDAQKISNEVLQYYGKPNSLYELSRKGQVATQQLFDIDKQVDDRIQFFEKFTDIKQRS